MNRKYFGVAAIALVSMLAGAILFHWLQPESLATKTVSGQTTVELRSIPLLSQTGQKSILGDWQGNILIVNFWAPWCAPCRREIPTLIKFHQDYTSRGVQVLGIAYDNEPQVSRFASDYQINYPLFLAENRSAMYNAAFGNSSGSLPYTAILDRDLKIRYQHHGEVSRQQLVEQLKVLKIQ